MRQPSFHAMRSATLVLLIANVAAFLVQLGFETYYSRFPLAKYFALSPWGLSHGYVWQLLTFQFMHGGWLHLILNCWVIYAFGRELESALGPTRFLTLYFTSGVLGGLLQAVAGVLLSGRFGGPVVGASAGAFGLVAAFATMYPERPLMLLLFFVIPVSMRAKYLLLFSGLLAVAGIVFPSDNIAHAAHLGGMLTGIAYIRFGSQWTWSFSGLGERLLRPFRRKSRLRVLDRGGLPRRSMPPAEDLPREEFLMREVDPILDKISAHGIQSLTDRERRILEAARSKMAHR